MQTRKVNEPKTPRIRNERRTIIDVCTSSSECLFYLKNKFQRIQNKFINDLKNALIFLASQILIGREMEMS